MSALLDGFGGLDGVRGLRDPLSAHSKSTITRHVNNLDAADAVTTWRDGSTKFAESTLGGRLLLASA